MTNEDAAAMIKSEWWKDIPVEVVAWFQLNEDKLCMDFSTYHKVLETTLGRSVDINEIAHPEILIQEILGNNICPKRN